MSAVILAYFACLFNVFGLLLFMSDTKRITDIVERMNAKAKIYAFVTVIGVSILAIHGKVYMALILAVEYVMILLWYWKKKQKCRSAAIKGMVAILVCTLTELLVIMLYHQRSENIMTIQYEIQITCYLGMAMSQYLLIIIKEVARMGDGFRRILMFTLGIKAVEDLVWLYLGTGLAVFKGRYQIMAGMMVIELIASYVTFFVLASRIEDRQKQKKRADIHLNTYEYYMNMEEEHRLIRKMYHDMKNQLMILEAEGQDTPDFSRKYGQATLEKLETIHQFYHTGQPSLDILLFEGKNRAKSRGIEFEAVVEEGCLDFMVDEDVNVIFSNAIMNAIEACDRITDGPKQIKIKAGTNLDDTLIYIKNTVWDKRKKGSLSSRKNDTKMHGIGMTSIQECVEKYEGYVSIIEEDGTFQLAILFGGGGSK